MQYTLSISTRSRAELVDITAQVQDVVRKSEVSKGICMVYVPHTTAGITINEGTDLDVPRDILEQLERLVPRDGPYRHVEGNADAHIKASLLGSSVLIPVSGGELSLGTWQAVLFGEFDGPRTRRVIVQVIGS
ncbi:MAG TPA: YjbQ family protein [Candidatus Latescibacteria bacterium]|nr:YjbQ family protein [Candidatus Latescibacterota bacterium]